MKPEKALRIFEGIEEVVGELPEDDLQVEEAFLDAKKALKKQIPAAPDRGTDEEAKVRYTEVYHCPACGGAFSGTGIAQYCYHCGQALLWPSFEEVIEEIMEDLKK